MAADFCEVELFRGILNLAKENVTTQEINKLFLTTDNEGRTNIHVAGK